MGKQQATRQRCTVERSFEPSRLSTTTLAQAYERVVSQHIRVKNLPIEWIQEQKTEELFQAGRVA